jgi:RNA polymerase sigma-54 factor
MKMEMAFGLRQEQQMRLAPQIIQSIEILQLPLLALEERMQAELIENPVLEMTEKAPETETADLPAPSAPEELPESFNSMDEGFRDHFSEWSTRRVDRSDRDPKMDAMQNTAARGMSLQEYLTSQLSLLDLTPRQRSLAESIVWNIDSNGYLQYPLEEILPSADAPEVTMTELEEALTTVQALEPPGVGARDLRECLLLQLDRDDPHFVLKAELINHHLEDIRTNRFPQITRDTGRSLEDIKHAVEFILTLTPKPGLAFDSTEPAYITPDVLVEEVEGEFDVRLQESGMPHLTISPFYRKLLVAHSDSSTTKDYIRKKIQAARWLIDAIEQRRTTLLKVSRAIVDAQVEFLRKGPNHLRPLRMSEVAKQVSVHVSTVSRAIAGKYMQTPQGVFEMRYFFTGGTVATATDVEGVSWQSIRDRISRLVQNEDRKIPFSDEDLAKELTNQGVDVSRRTVTKYRKAMGIPSSRRRRTY